jgi:lysozyme
MSLADAVKTAARLIFDAEGCRTEAYLDTLASIPMWTIGFGTTFIGQRPVRSGMTCTLDQAYAWAEAVITETAKFVDTKVIMPLNDNQLAALTSFVYNCGDGTFERSNVLAELNAGFYLEAANRLLDYDEAGDRVVGGLELRRERERALFLKPPAIASTPSPDSADALNDAELQKLRDMPS